ncbi:transforming growth factor-beta-induced protein ig-h3-like isoform X1 [Haliotis rufescens]|uniref:transforming growth factor-beta-induced protein ig-h3-like isoform X1 n=1 Tax=Haliotis rufescens TaxID=6454 RepID=UPI001EAFD024|nr:transforming growth factor-beta-induced protein ig-h3-like isoform X1 [Haliotis rufescens]
MNVHVVWGLILLGVCDVAARTIMEALASRYDIMSFSSLVRRAGLESLLNTGKYTVFAPVDAAFQLLPEQMISQLYLKENLPQLKALVKYHIVPYTGNTHRHWTGEKVNTLASKPVRMVTYPHNKVTVVNGVVLTESNLSVSNGHIYLLSTTLAAPSGDIVKSLQQDSTYSKFLTAAALSGMTNKLKEDNITVLAPSDDAFLKMNKTRTDALFNNVPLLRALVEFHILPGVYYSYGWYNKEDIHDDNPKYDITYTVHEYGNHLFWITPFDGSVWNQDWLATNGVIHAISGVKYTWPFIGDLNRIIG